MHAQHFSRVSELFEAARHMSVLERARFLETQCREDAPLREEVLALLRHHESDDSQLDVPIAEGLGSRSGDSIIAEALLGPHPEKIGQYRILGVLGQGGMGVVYLAEQERPRRRVALKVIRAPLVSPSLLRRFELETQLLGRLHHPGIAQIFEAGIAGGQDGSDAGTRSAQPFFAMEYIKGLPLTEFAQKRGLNMRQRLELLIRICHAVQHAHLQGVIHRDLKPSNILVVDGASHAGDTGGASAAPSGTAAEWSEGGLLPKILDFGVARCTDSDVQATTLHTDIGQLIGTIPYMSPEQVAGDAAALDARSDVYALGVIGYELLSGRRPHELQDKSVPEAVRMIGEDDPVPLSSLDRAFRGDLDTIIGKALEKDPARRYQSAAELALDIRRSLDDQPIIARPASAMYNLRKFAKRHTAVVVGMITAAVLLIVAVTGTTIGLVLALDAEGRASAAAIAAKQDAQRATEAEADAKAGQRVASAVTDFLTTMFHPRHPTIYGKDLKVIDVVRDWEGRIDEQFADEPEIAGALHLEIGQVLSGLGEYQDAARHFTTSAETAEELFGPDDKRALFARLHEVLAVDHFTPPAEIEPIERALIERYAAAVGENYRQVLRLRTHHALTLHALGRTPEAVPIAEDVAARAREALDDDDELTGTAINNLAMLLKDRGRFEEAEKLYREAIEIDMRIYGEDDPETAVSKNNLAVLLRSQNRMDEAESLFSEVLTMRQKALPLDHPDTLLSMNNLAMLMVSRGRHEEAEPLLRETLEAHRRKLGDRNMGTLIVMSNYGRVLVDLKRFDEAEQCTRTLIELGQAALAPDHWRHAQFRGLLGECLLASGRLEEAETELLAAHAVLAEAHGRNDVRTKAVATALVKLYESQGQPERAQPYRSD